MKHSFLIFCFGVFSLASISQAAAQEEVTSHSFKVQHIPGCLELRVPANGRKISSYDDEHTVVTVRQGGGLLGGVQFVADTVTASRDGTTHSEAEIAAAGYTGSAGEGPNETIYSRQFKIKRLATVKVCIKPGLRLEGKEMTFDARAKPVDLSVKVDPGEPASQLISKATADEIDRDNRKFKADVEKQVAALVKDLKSRTTPLSPLAITSLWGSQGLSETVAVNFAGKGYDTVVRMRQVSR